MASLPHPHRRFRSMLLVIDSYLLIGSDLRLNLTILLGIREVRSNEAVRNYAIEIGLFSALFRLLFELDFFVASFDAFESSRHY